MKKKKKEVHIFKNREIAWSPSNGFQRCEIVKGQRIRPHSSKDKSCHPTRIRHGSHVYTLTGIVRSSDTNPTLLNKEEAAKLGHVPPKALGDETVIPDRGYKIDLFFHPIENVFIGDVPELEGVCVQGEDLSEVGNKVVEQIELVFDLEEESNDPPEEEIVAQRIKKKPRRNNGDDADDDEYDND